MGMKIIPIYRNSKVPVGKKWNENYDLLKSRQMIATNQYNIGLLLGEWIDIEGDTDEANLLLEKMIDGLPHPMYRSNKSTHHLFLNVGKFSTRKFMDIEFRSFGVQSVLPPSVHISGDSYHWLKGTTFPAPPVPSSLQDFYLQHYIHKPKLKVKVPRPKIKPDFIKSFCRVCKKKESIHQKRLLLEVRAFQEFHLPWMCHQCREVDVRPVCRKIRKIIRREQLIEAKQQYFPKNV